jgi:hypothetical protein
LPQKIVALLLITLTFFSSSPLTAAQDSLESISWGTKSSPDFSHWNSSTYITNSVDHSNDKRNVWSMTSPLGVHVLNAYFFPTSQADLVIEVELSYDEWEINSDTWGQISLTDTDSNEIFLRVSYYSLVVVDCNCDNYVSWEWITDVETAENEWHTLRMELSSSSTSKIYWNGVMVKEYNPLGFEWVKMSAAILKTDLSISSWKISPEALQPGDGGSESGSSFFSIMTGLAIGALVVMLGIAVVLGVKKYKKVSRPTPTDSVIKTTIPPSLKETIQHPQEIVIYCPICGAISEGRDRFCSNCGFQLITE